MPSALAASKEEVSLDGHVDKKTPEELGYITLDDGKFVDLENSNIKPTNRYFSGKGRDLDPPAFPKK